MPEDYRYGTFFGSWGNISSNQPTPHSLGGSRMHRNMSGTLRVLAESFCLTSCDSGVRSPDTSPSATLTLTAQSAYVFAGQSMKLTVTDTRGSSDVIWSVEGTEGENGPYGNVNPLYTTGNAEKELVVKVVVASRSDSTKRASVTITVLPTGTITPTSNPLVAEYSLVPRPAQMCISDLGKTHRISSERGRNL